MSQFGGKMSKFWGKFDIVSTDLRIILSNFVATDVYALFKKSIKKICNMMFKTKGGGVKGFLNNVQKKLQIWRNMAPLRWMILKEDFNYNGPCHPLSPLVVMLYFWLHVTVMSRPFLCDLRQC